MSVGKRLGTTQTQDFVLLGALGLAAYIVYNLIKGVKTTVGVATSAVQAIGAAGQQAQDTITSAIAKVISAAVLPPKIVPTGAVSLPNGLVIPVSQLATYASNFAFDPTSNTALFGYQGITYQVNPQQWDPQGNLIATEVPDFGLQSSATGGWS